MYIHMLTCLHMKVFIRFQYRKLGNRGSRCLSDANLGIRRREKGRLNCVILLFVSMTKAKICQEQKQEEVSWSGCSGCLVRSVTPNNYFRIRPNHQALISLSTLPGESKGPPEMNYRLNIFWEKKTERRI